MNLKISTSGKKSTLAILQLHFFFLQTLFVHKMANNYFNNVKLAILLDKENYLALIYWI